MRQEMPDIPHCRYCLNAEQVSRNAHRHTKAEVLQSSKVKTRCNRTPVTFEPQLRVVLDTSSKALASHLALEHKMTKDKAKIEMRSRIRPTTRRALDFLGAFSTGNSAMSSSQASSLTPLLSTPSSDSQYALVGRFLDPEIYQQY